ncbi:MAG: UDP-3-O-acyl-N-acetylglucosamine deacetylase [Deltaproteobacteria bacterium]|nr:UDP-3-O-acyl-N-acetylglucosamine deacetylase [Deltaproteobacteria bacterium]
MSSRLCIIVEDDTEVVKVLQPELEQFGYLVKNAQNLSDFKMLLRDDPSLILLDLWLPDGDGFHVLKDVKKSLNCPVIVISAQGDPETIVQAMRLGADHYLEKPVNMKKLAHVIGNLDNESKPLGHDLETFQIVKYFPKSDVRVKKVPRRTLAKSVVFFGVGIHTGKKFGLQIEPSAEQGISVQPLGSSMKIPLCLDFVESKGLCTTFKVGSFEVKTIEHLLSALWGSGITDCVIKTGQEIPILDGSAKDFIDAFTSVGVIERGETFAIILNESEELDFGSGKKIAIRPSEEFKVSYTLEVNSIVTKASFSQLDNYASEIAPSRTFSFLNDVARAHQNDLAQGGRFNNFVLFDDNLKPINTDLRFLNEPARHKILDLIGDLYTTGFFWLGHFYAHKTGHLENIELAKYLVSKYLTRLYE